MGALWGVVVVGVLMPGARYKSWMAFLVGALPSADDIAPAGSLRMIQRALGHIGHMQVPRYSAAPARLVELSSCSGCSRTDGDGRVPDVSARAVCRPVLADGPASYRETLSPCDARAWTRQPL